MPCRGRAMPKEYRAKEDKFIDTSAYHGSQIVTTFSMVDRMRKLFYAEQGNTQRKNDPEVRELFDFIEKMRGEFESIERPMLEIETPRQEAVSEERSQTGPSHTAQTTNSPKSKGVESPKSASNSLKPIGLGSPKSSRVTTEQNLDPESEPAKLELEFGKISKDYSTDEIGGWEFDELEQELRSGISESNK